jgi:hypothetical protein
LDAVGTWTVFLGTSADVVQLESNLVDLLSKNSTKLFMDVCGDYDMEVPF